MGGSNLSRPLASVFIIAMLGAFASADEPAIPRLHLAGDSTMADKPTDAPNPEHGWGQLLPTFFKDSSRVVNHAANGRSTRSFIAEGRWQTLVDALDPGDWVIIQFAHNDEKIFPTARGEFQENLRRFIADARARKANPILATPCARRSWDDAGALIETHGDYPEAIRAVATEANVPLLDMSRLTAALESGHGVEGSKRLHVDNTHYSAYGAERVAALAVQELLRLGLPLAEWLR